MIRNNTKVKIGGLSPEEYAAQWGGDPVYMKSPNLPGDGYLFYNFSSESEPRDAQHLNDFATAIERTIKVVKNNLAAFEKNAVEELEALLSHVKGLTPEPEDEFTKGYVTAALWSETDDDGNPLDAKYEIGDIAPETMTEMQADCVAFQKDNAADIAQCKSVEQAGHDFLLSRNGQGCGYFDRDLGDVGTRLQAAAKAFGECNFYIGDDGRVHA